MNLSVKLLGELEIKRGASKRLNLPTRKTRVLFAYLLTNADKPLPRERLTDLLWGDRSEQQARHSLNQALLAIRKLGASAERAVLTSDSQHVILHSEIVSSDLASFWALVADDPEQAISVYSGPFLEGFTVSGPAVEQWLRGTRDELHEMACDALHRVAEDAERQGKTEDALLFTRRLLSLDPVREDAHQRLIRLLHQSGDRIGALRQYEVCADALRDELDVAPNAETKALIEAIRRTADTPEASRLPLSAKEAEHVDLSATAATLDDDRSTLPGRFFPPSSPWEGKPAIAVLPLRNVSGDQDYTPICDGISEDLIFSLSAFRWFSVLGRGSSFQFRAHDIDPRLIGTHLGARYVLDGSVLLQRSRLRLRIELLDAATGEQLWREQYDVNKEGLFDVLDKIVEHVVAAVEIRIDNIEMMRAVAKPPEHINAYERVKRGYWILYQQGPEGFDKSSQQFEKALELDSNYAPAYAGRAYCELVQAFADYSDVRYERLEACIKWVRHALGLDPDDPRSLRYFGQAQSYLSLPQEGLEAASRAVAVCPSYASGYSGLAFSLDLVGRFNEAIPAVDRTVSLVPYDPILHRCIMSKSVAKYQIGNYEEAETIARYSLAVADWSVNNLMLLASLGQRGDRDKSVKQIGKMKQLYPEVTLDRMTRLLPFCEIAHREHLADGITKAGWIDPSHADRHKAKVGGSKSS